MRPVTPLEALAGQMARLGCRVHLINQPVPGQRPGFLSVLPPVNPLWNGREIGVVALLTPEEDTILRSHRRLRQSWSDALARELRDRLQ